MKFIPGCGCCGAANCYQPSEPACPFPNTLTYAFINALNNFTTTLTFDSGFTRWDGTYNVQVAVGVYELRTIRATNCNTGPQYFRAVQIFSGTPYFDTYTASAARLWTTISCAPVFYEFVGATDQIQVYE
jgi:hypothetical protein